MGAVEMSDAQFEALGPSMVGVVIPDLRAGQVEAEALEARDVFLHSARNAFDTTLANRIGEVRVAHVDRQVLQ